MKYTIVRVLSRKICQTVSDKIFFQKSTISLLESPPGCDISKSFNSSFRSEKKASPPKGEFLHKVASCFSDPFQQNTSEFIDFSVKKNLDFGNLQIASPEILQPKSAFSGSGVKPSIQHKTPDFDIFDSNLDLKKPIIDIEPRKGIIDLEDEIEEKTEKKEEKYCEYLDMLKDLDFNEPAAKQQNIEIHTSRTIYYTADKN